MAPRKRPASSSSKKSNSNPQPSQPAKFGIQHFFERHTQAAASQRPNDKPPSFSSVKCVNPSPIHLPPTEAHPNPEPAEAPHPAACIAPDDLIAIDEKDQDTNPSPISPDMSKYAPAKRAKFSPGMLIKQSQDDGGEEVTWRISPVNERLKSLAGRLGPKLLPGPPDTSKPSLSSIVRCPSREKESNCSGKTEKTLSSPNMAAPERSAQQRQISSSVNGGMRGSQSPFRTPPSVPNGPGEITNGLVSKGTPKLLDQYQHRKTLLDLLDQVEDAIVVEVDSSVCLPENEVALPDFTRTESESLQKKKTSDGLCIADHTEKFLVLEVSEKHLMSDSSNQHYSFKVLRLLNEQNCQERVLRLCDEWFYSIVQPGDTVNVIGEFDTQGKCVVDQNNNLCIVHPDFLISGTRVPSSFTCLRRAVFDERLRFSDHSTAALVGTLLHQIFQAGLLKDCLTREFLEEYMNITIQKNIEGLYACDVTENEMHAILSDAIPKIMNWLRTFKDIQDSRKPIVKFGQWDEKKSVSISEVIDIEEMAWAPKYGLKGIIDASVRVKMVSNNDCSNEKIMPFELKTGKGTTGHSAMEHQAQVILYTLLMTERYASTDIDSGLLYYLHTDQTVGIKAQRSDLVGLIMQRNELASYLLKAFHAQTLPPILQSPSICKSCRHINTCAIYHKAQGGNCESPGIADAFSSFVKDLTSAHLTFLQHWDRLIDMEAKTSSVAGIHLRTISKLRNEKSTSTLSSMILDTSDGFPAKHQSKGGQYVYHFVHQDFLEPKLQGQKLDGEHSLPSSADSTLRCGDYVILYAKSGRTAVAKGVIANISQSRVSISLFRVLRLPWSNKTEEDLPKEIWRIDKDEISSSYATMRFNLVQLFFQDPQSSRLRKLIVDLEAPKFDSGSIFSQDPAISYTRTEKSLNNDQRKAIFKMLTAKDYALILGMPGTGKTSTMVHAVKALLIRGGSVLLTSYTNSAVDNLLLKLKAQKIDFVRIGRHEAVHEDIRGHCVSGVDKRSLEEIRQRIDQAHVVGVTCLGVNHPLLVRKRFDVCIMDEAGQITLPVSLGPLMLASMFVLVGDHYQLPPLVQSAVARENGLGVSLFCKLSEANPQAVAALQCQYRMSAPIMELSNALIYGNRLRCGSPEIANGKLKLSMLAPMTFWLREILTPHRSVVFINTDLLPAAETRENKVVHNPMEAFIISKITKELLYRDVAAEEIGIITPYNSQAELIRQVLEDQVETHTIDRYQGRDKECILLSFVRSSDKPTTCKSSLLGDWHRINVAITRAKKKLIMVGSCKTLSRVPLLKLLIEKVQEWGNVLSMSENDFQHLNCLKKTSQDTAL